MSARPAPKQPLQRRSRESLEAIVAAAMRLMANRPLAEIGADEIAAEAGVSIGLLYTRFKGKDALLDYVLEVLQNTQNTQLREQLAEARWAGVGLEPRLDWLFAQLERSAAERPALIRTTLGALLASSPERTAPAAERNSETVELIAGWLLASGEIRAAEPALAARVTTVWLINSCHLARLYAFSFPGIPATAAVGELRRAALAALRAPA